MKYIKGVFLLVMVVLGGNASAATTTDAKVIWAGTYGDGRLFVALDTTINEPGCERARFDVEPSNQNIKYMLSIAMTALTTNKTVRVTTDGCYAGYPTLNDTAGTATHFFIYK